MYLTSTPKLQEFETDLKIESPSAGEISYLAHKNLQCNFYYMGNRPVNRARQVQKPRLGAVQGEEHR
jgi:hypothetical protein